MISYLIRRLLLLPLTLFGIILVNFVIINFAPGDPSTLTEISSAGGATRREDRSLTLGLDDRYLQFREHFGLTLPVLLNSWPQTSDTWIRASLWSLSFRRASPEEKEEMPLSSYDALKIKMGDRARFVMPKLLHLVEDDPDLAIQQIASRQFARGGIRQSLVEASLTPSERQYNREVARSNEELRSLILTSEDTPATIALKKSAMRAWYEAHRLSDQLDPTFLQRVGIFFFDTRFFRYMSRVLTLDFGSIRNDSSKTVLREVICRFKYSLTLALFPMCLTFFLSLFFGFVMAFWKERWPDYALNILFLILYSIPVYVAAPFLIEWVAQGNHFPWTNIPIPLNGFTSPDRIYMRETSWQRLGDIVQHLVLPLTAILYGSLAVQARLARTSILEVLHQDYIRTARAKGVSPIRIAFKHVGRNAAITLVTSIAGSLGIVLGGSLIVETLFEIPGFGKFFYDAILNWDYNVIMFSALAGSFLTLIGYLLADIAYTLLDPRITLE